MAIKTFNADDHPILRKGVADLIQQTNGLEWVGSAEDGNTAFEKIKEIQPDVAILDVDMPHLSGLEVAEKLINDGSKTEFVILTLFKEERLFKKAMISGVKGYLLKESREDEIVAAIRSVYQGRPYVNASLTHWLFSRGKNEENVIDQLSEQEINILKLVAREKTSVEIAEMLFISPKTVANHRRNIGKKLDLGGEQNGVLKWAIQNQHLLMK